MSQPDNIPNNNNNVLPNFKIPTIFYPFILMIVIMIIGIFMIMYKVKISSSSPSTLSDSQPEILSNLFLIMFVVLLIFGLSVMLLPNFKDLKELFFQIKNVSFTVLYTIFLILFFRLTPSNIINNYAYIILPLTLIISIYMFYIGAKQNYIESFNINYERIKSVILFFCFITLVIIYYNIDPGGYITKYFGSSLLLTIMLSVFALLYIILLLTLSNDTNQNSTNITNILSKFSNFSVYGTALFFVFLIVMTVLISTYPGGFFKDKNISTSVIILLLLVCVIWVSLLSIFLFPEISNNVVDNTKTNLFKRALLFLFGIIISALVIFWIVYNIQNLSGDSSIISFILNILIVILVLALIYKTINVKMPEGNAKKNAFFEIIINLIFYIPCLFSNLFNNIFNFSKNQQDSSSNSSLLVLLFVIILLVIFIFTPNLFNLFYLQGGKLLVNKPVDTNMQYSLGTYEELNGSDKFDYQYAISCWVFIESAAPNTSPSYNKYTSLLNFGNKPNVLYNGSTNTLMITMQQKDLKKTTKNKLMDFDENGNRIIYIKNNVLLQKWNNIIINYNGGVLDIFLNGELVKSDIGVVPYYTLDNLTIGEDNGIKGGICNVVYFKKALTSTNIYLLYNMVKNKDLPVSDNSIETIIKK
jgi:cytochrome bd-type quinol oxidase subunit 2